VCEVTVDLLAQEVDQLELAHCTLGNATQSTRTGFRVAHVAAPRLFVVHRKSAGKVPEKSGVFGTVAK
jgi:hypothetical protein